MDKDEEKHSYLLFKFKLGKKQKSLKLSFGLIALSLIVLMIISIIFFPTLATILFGILWVLAMAACFFYFLYILPIWAEKKLSEVNEETDHH